MTRDKKYMFERLKTRVIRAQSQKYIRTYGKQKNHFVQEMEIINPKFGKDKL